MKLNILPSAELSSVPMGSIVEETPAESTPTVSMENVATTSCGPNDAPPDRGMIKYQVLPFTRKETSEGVEWRIYLNILDLKDSIVNMFITIIRQVQAGEKVFIHAPSFVDDHLAIGMWSAISFCKGRVVMAAPYCLNTASAFLATAAKELVISNIMYWNITAPIVFGIGAHLDVASGSAAQVNIYQRMYAEFVKHGYLTSDEVRQILEGQTNLALYGPDLYERLAR